MTMKKAYIWWSPYSQRWVCNETDSPFRQAFGLTPISAWDNFEKNFLLNRFPLPVLNGVVDKAGKEKAS